MRTQIFAGVVIGACIGGAISASAWATAPVAVALTGAQILGAATALGLHWKMTA